MKDVSEYSNDDWEMVCTQAKKIAMAAIHSTYEEIHDDEEVDMEDVCKVKKAVEILDFLKNSLH